MRPDPPDEPAVGEQIDGVGFVEAWACCDDGSMTAPGEGATDGPVPTNLQFIAAVERIAERCGWWRLPSPAGLVRSWALMVEHCESGYVGTVDEYDDDLNTRDLVQSVLNDPLATSFPEAQVWATEIARSDARFAAILVPLPLSTIRRPWWRAGVPKRGNPEFVEDIYSHYGLVIDEA